MSIRREIIHLDCTSCLLVSSDYYFDSIVSNNKNSEFGDFGDIQEEGDLAGDFGEWTLRIGSRIHPYTPHAY